MKPRFKPTPFQTTTQTGSYSRTSFSPFLPIISLFRLEQLVRERALSFDQIGLLPRIAPICPHLIIFQKPTIYEMVLHHIPTNHFPLFHFGTKTGIPKFHYARGAFANENHFNDQRLLRLPMDWYTKWFKSF